MPFISYGLFYVFNFKLTLLGWFSFGKELFKIWVFLFILPENMIYNISGVLVSQQSSLYQTIKKLKSIFSNSFNVILDDWIIRQVVHYNLSKKLYPIKSKWRSIQIHQFKSINIPKYCKWFSEEALLSNWGIYEDHSEVQFKSQIIVSSCNDQSDSEAGGGSSSTSEGEEGCTAAWHCWLRGGAGALAGRGTNTSESSEQRDAAAARQTLQTSPTSSHIAAVRFEEKERYNIV